jgi:hypothetical protein
MYQPRRPRASPLWQILTAAWDAFLAGMKTATDTLLESFRARLNLPDGRLAAVAAVHTFGDYLFFYPHLHVLAADRLFDSEGRFHIDGGALPPGAHAKGMGTHRPRTDSPAYPGIKRSPCLACGLRRGRATFMQYIIRPSSSSNPQSTIHNPQSTIHNPQSSIINHQSSIINHQLERSQSPAR